MPGFSRSRGAQSGGATTIHVHVSHRAEEVQERRVLILGCSRVRLEPPGAGIGIRMDKRGSDLGTGWTECLACYSKAYWA